MSRARLPSPQEMRVPLQDQTKPCPGCRAVRIWFVVNQGKFRVICGAGTEGFVTGKRQKRASRPAFADSRAIRCAVLQDGQQFVAGLLALRTVLPDPRPTLDWRLAQPQSAGR